MGVIIRPDKVNNITEINHISKTIDLDLVAIQLFEKGSRTTFIHAYAPSNDNYSEEENEAFFQ